MNGASTRFWMRLAVLRCSGVAAKPGWARQRDDAAPTLAEAQVQLVGEEQVGELRLAVRLPGPVSRAAPSSGRRGRCARSPRRATTRSRRGRADAAGASVVSAKWPRWLVPMCSSNPSAVRPCATAMIPALFMSMSSGPDQSRGERAHRCEVGQVERPHLGVAVDPLGHPLALRGIAHREDDVRAGRGQRTRGRGTDPARGAGDDDCAAGEVGEIARGPGGRRHAVSRASTCANAASARASSSASVSSCTGCGIRIIR